MMLINESAHCNLLQNKFNSKLPINIALYPKEQLHFSPSKFFFPVALQPNAGHGLHILEVSRSHTTTHHSR